jgi:hypothetical protein
VLIVNKEFLQMYMYVYLNVILKKVCTVGGQIKLGHLKFNLCKSDHSIVNIFVSVYIICHTKVNLFVTKP